MGGFFLTSRDIFENPIWQDVAKFRIFFYIVGNAVFSEEGVRVSDITLQRGQYLRSFRNLQKDLEYLEKNAIKIYSLSTVKRKVDQLVKEERLKTEDTDLGTLFTVVNYEEYQGFGRHDKSKVETPKEHQRNTNETPTEQQRNNNNKDNKDEQENQENELLCAFELFWSDYPVKKGKKKALEKFLLKAKKHGAGIIIKGAQDYIEECRLKNKMQFVQHPTTFLNGEHYNDEFDLKRIENKLANVPRAYQSLQDWAEEEDES